MHTYKTANSSIHNGLSTLCIFGSSLTHINCLAASVHAYQWPVSLCRPGTKTEFLWQTIEICGKVTTVWIVRQETHTHYIVIHTLHSHTVTRQYVCVLLAQPQNILVWWEFNLGFLPWSIPENQTATLLHVSRAVRYDTRHSAKWQPTLGNVFQEPETSRTQNYRKYTETWMYRIQILIPALSINRNLHTP